MATEKELARYGYTGFGEKLGRGAPENKALYLEDLESKTKAELEKLADMQDLEVEGTGRGGYVSKDDLIRVLRAAG